MGIFTYTLQLAAYGSIRVDIDQTLSYMNGDAPHLIVRDGSDSKRLTPGQSLPIDSEYAQVCNPFPRPVEVLMARGLPISMGPEPFDLTRGQLAVVTSSFLFTVTAPEAAILILLRRGKALISMYDSNASQINVQAVTVSSFNPAMLMAKPATVMPTPTTFLGVDGEPDPCIISVSGTCVALDYNTWMTANTAAGAGPQKTQFILSAQPGRQQFMATADQAVILRRPFNGTTFYVQAQHLGADVGEFD